MLEEKKVRKILKGKIDEGIKKFIIYPFGTNGILIKNCLEDVFNTKPVLIIDNEYEKYHSGIENSLYLKEHYEKDTVVLLTIEDEELNRKMEEYLRTFVPRDRIVNFFCPVKKEKNSRVIVNQFSLDNILPDFKGTEHICMKHECNGKIKVRFLHSSYVFWNTIRTICAAFKEDKKYDILIVLREDDSDIMKEQMIREGYSYVMVSEYDVKEDLPDIMVLYHPWERSVIKDCREYTNLIVAATLMLIRYGYSLDEMWKTMRIGFGRFKPDYYLFDSLLYEEIKNSEYYSNQIIEMGNAKFDGIYQAGISEKVYPNGWEKLKGKKVILWCTDHGFQDGNEVTDYITFDLYAKYIFQYALKHPEMGIIMRLHRSFVRDLLEQHFWTQEDVTVLRRYCEETANIIWDETDTYDTAYALSDAILTDALCGITCSALPTLKPICVMYRDRQVKVFHRELTDCYYSAYTADDLRTFFEMTGRGEDRMYELRKAASGKFVKNFDGKNGKRIKDFIEDKYFMMQKEPQKKIEADRTRVTVEDI